MLNLERYLTIPFVWNGRGFAGTDCLGLVLLYFQEELGIAIPDYQHGAASCKEITNSDFWTNVGDLFVPVDRERPQRHDLLLFKTNGSRTPNHIGIYLEQGRFLQMTANAGASTTRLYFWENKLEGAYRHRELIQ